MIDAAAIPDAMVQAATRGIEEYGATVTERRLFGGGGSERRPTSEGKARAALLAAGVPELLAERNTYRGLLVALLRDRQRESGEPDDPAELDRRLAALEKTSVILIEREELAALIARTIKPFCLFSDTTVPTEVAEHVVAALPESEPVGWQRSHLEFPMPWWRNQPPTVFDAPGWFPVYRKPQA